MQWLEHFHSWGVVNALPRDKRVLKEAAGIGTGRFALSESTHSLSWLSEHGDCIDQLVLEESCVDSAANGALLRGGR